MESKSSLVNDRRHDKRMEICLTFHDNKREVNCSAKILTRVEDNHNKNYFSRVYNTIS